MSALMVSAIRHRRVTGMMLDESRPRLREDVQYRELDDGAVIYDTSAEKIHTLNITAAYIWNCCDGDHDLVQIASELREHAKISQEKALQDVRQAVEYFQNEGLL